MNSRHRLASISALVVLLVATPNACFALMEIELVSKDRAKALGLEIRSNAAGPDAVRIELEFETKGELKNYSRVDLEIHDGWKLLSSSTLREEKSKPGCVLVGFAADRSKLDKFSLRVVTGVGTRTMIGYEIRVKEFVDPALVSTDRPRVIDREGKPVTAGVQGYVSDVDAMAFPGRPAIVSATVSAGKLGAGDQTQVYATDPLLQAALISAAERQVLVEVTYHPEVVPAPAPADAQSNRVIQVRLLDQPRYQRARAIALNPPKITRTLDGAKTTFPEKTIAAGATVALAALEACHSEDWSGAKPPALADLEKAKLGNHVHLVFDNPMPVEFMRHKIAIMELVYSEKMGMLVRSADDKVYYGTKYTHDKMTAFEKWYRQTLPADAKP